MAQPNDRGADRRGTSSLDEIISIIGATREVVVPAMEVEVDEPAFNAVYQNWVAVSARADAPWIGPGRFQFANVSGNRVNDIGNEWWPRDKDEILGATHLMISSTYPRDSSNTIEPPADGTVWVFTATKNRGTNSGNVLKLNVTLNSLVTENENTNTFLFAVTITADPGNMSETVDRLQDDGTDWTVEGPPVKGTVVVPEHTTTERIPSTKVWAKRIDLGATDTIQLTDHDPNTLIAITDAFFVVEWKNRMTWNENSEFTDHEGVFWRVRGLSEIGRQWRLQLLCRRIAGA